jgi:hypothetical protein
MSVRACSSERGRVDRSWLKVHVMRAIISDLSDRLHAYRDILAHKRRWFAYARVARAYSRPAQGIQARLRSSPRTLKRHLRENVLFSHS